MGASSSGGSSSLYSLIFSTQGMALVSLVMALSPRNGVLPWAVLPLAMSFVAAPPLHPRSTLGFSRPPPLPVAYEADVALDAAGL